MQLLNSTPLGRPMSIDVLDRRLVSPQDLLARQAEHGRHLVAFLGTRRPAAQHDGQHARFIQAGFFRQLFDVDLVLRAQLIHSLWRFHGPAPFARSSYAKKRSTPRHARSNSRTSAGTSAAMATRLSSVAA